MTDSRSAVDFAAPAVMPGTDLRRSVQLLEAELGPGDFSALPELPQRGHHGTLLGRSVAQLAELYAELTSYGWRLVQRPGADHLRATTRLSADVDTLADVRGERQETSNAEPGPLRVEILGPVSLAARLHLPQGEKILIDHGARRDLAASLAAGLQAHCEHILSSIRPPALEVTVCEPEYHRVRRGAVPTVSGYQQIRSLGRDETRALVTEVLNALRAAGVDSVVLDTGRPVTAEQVEDFFSRSRSGASTAVDGFVLPVHRAEAADWERAAELAEAGARLQASLLRPTGSEALPEVSALAQRVSGPWQALGMPLFSLEAFTLTPISTGEQDQFAQLTEPAALRATTRVRDAASALTDQMRA